MTYSDFLAKKQRTIHPIGVASPDDTHPILHEWQTSITKWAARAGRAAIFADCGLGKTFMQLEWARLSADRTLIVAPLSVARQTAREAKKLDTEVRYVRHASDLGTSGVYVTNYEMVRAFEGVDFDAVVLDESSILKSLDGSTRKYLTERFASTPARLACTATPAPNDVAELCNHAEWLGIIPRNEMLAAYFVHDEIGWRIKGHAVEPMHEWMAQWAVAVRRPSDLGYPDEGYDLPPLTVVPHVVEVAIEQEGQLFATDLGGIGGRSTVRRHTLDARVEVAATLALQPGQWIMWCGLNDEAKALADAIPDAINVDGAMPADEKADVLEGFQDGGFRVLITKPSIAGFGMNFQQCHQMCFVGLSDSYESYYQAVRRCWRFGQQHPVDAHVVVSELEQQIVDNVARKQTEASQTTDLLVRFSPLRKDSDESDAALRHGRSKRRMLASTARR